MPKLGGPLFSVEARKSLAKALSYQRRPGGASVYGYNKPKVPLTTAQHTQRDKIMWCVLSWRRLPDASKAEWEAKAKGQGQSGYSYFVSQTCGYIFDPECVLYLPLYYPELSGGSFKSRDSYGHLSTVTGATWGSLGRTLDGDGDKITIPYHSAWNFGAGEFCIEIWIATGASGLWQDVFNVGRSPTHESLLIGLATNQQVYCDWNSTDTYLKSTTLLTVGECFHIVYQRVVNTAEIYVNAVRENTADFTGVTLKTPSNGLSIGENIGTGFSSDFNGLVGEVRIYTRALNPQEIQHNCLATKWRYG